MHYHCNLQKMYQLLRNCKERDWVFILPIVLLAFYRIERHFFWLISDTGPGLPQTTDSKWYLAYANDITVNLTNGLDVNDVLYLGYNTLLTLLLTLFKDPVVIVFIQTAAASLSVILVFKIAYILFNRTTAVIASVVYCFTYEFTLWSLYILSDSFFVNLLLLCVYFLLMAFESGRTRYKALFAASALYMAVFRPAGILALLFIAVYILIRLDKNTIREFLKARAMVIGGFAAVAFLILAVLAADNRLDSLVSSLQFEVKKVLYNVYARGWIYDIPTAQAYKFEADYTVNIGNSLILSFFVNNWKHILVLYGKRALAFLGTWVWTTDLKSLAGVATFIQNLLPATLFVVGTISALRNGSFRKASIAWLLVLAVFMFCVLVFIDAMYRYRFPAIPFIIIITAYGTERIITEYLVSQKYKLGMLLYGTREDADSGSGL